MPTAECVIGAGAIGLSLAAFLAKRAPVVVYAHPDQADALRVSGITVSGDIDTHITPPQLHLVTSASELPAGARYWLCTKAFDVAPLTTSLQHRLSSGVTVLLANGLGIYSDVTAILGHSTIIRALPSYGAHRLEISHVRVSGQPRYDIASASAAAAARDRVSTDLQELGAQTTTITTVQTAEWRKLLVATTVTTLASLANQHNGIILESPPLRALAEDVLQELRSIATSAGVNLSDIPNDLFFRNLQNHAGNTNSLLAALRVGLPTELEYTLLRPLMVARSHGMKAPRLETIYRLLRCIDQHHLLQNAHV